MKLIKSFTVKIDGNKSKLNYLTSNLIEIDKLSSYVFSLGKERWNKNFNLLYQNCREKFPTLNSRVVQTFLRMHYCFQESKKLPKKVVKASLYIDQSFDIQKNETTKLTNYWLKFHRKRFPLFGKKNLERIHSLKKIKVVQIYNRMNQLYCKLVFVDEMVDPTGSTDPREIVGLDINSARIVLSNRKFYHCKQLKHRKIEHYKNKQKKRNLNNFNKNEVHNITSKIVKDLQSTGIKVLVLEDLRNLRKGCTDKIRNKSTSKKNYIVNSIPTGMFRSFLTYKCNQVGIKVEIINPAYTSQTCSTHNILGERSGYNFVCTSYDHKLDADLNASRNIWNRYIRSKCATNQFSANTDLISVENLL